MVTKAVAKPAKAAKKPAEKKVSVAASPEKTVKKPRAPRKTPVPAVPVTSVAPVLAVKAELPPPVTRLPSSPPAALRIHQVFYRQDQVPYLDPAFIPFDNSNEGNPLLEFFVFNKIAKEEPQTTRLWGALSWKFTQKTGLKGADLVNTIKANPGYDVYFCNPHPETESLHYNLWLQGETSHPHFLALAKEIFKSAGLDESLLLGVQPSALFASTNYFVATRAFWVAYLEFIKKILRLADKGLTEPFKSMLLSSAADRKKVHAGANYLPFIVERLFGTFLQTEGARFKAYKYRVAHDDSANDVNLRLLREMRDMALTQNSLWLAACWVNYRNLYFSHLHNPAWLQQYLRAITPTKIHFSAMPAITVQQK